MFENLLWRELEEKHKEKWDYLEEKYHLQSLHRSHAFMAYAKEPPPNYGAWALYNTLDFYSIAQYCLNVCYHYIFDSDYSVDISEYPWLREYDASDPDDRFYKVHEMIGIEGRKRYLDKEGRLLYAELKNAFCRH